MKKFLCSLLAISMLFPFTSCQNQNSESESRKSNLQSDIGDTGGLHLPLTTKDETVTWAVASSVTNLNDLYFKKRLQEITGVNVQIEAYPTSTIQEKIRVLAASKKLPDIVGAGFGNNEQINDLAVQGAFASVDDKLELMPNFKSIFYEKEENKWIFNSYQASDGHLYVMPSYDINRDVNHGMLYRKDIFDKHNIRPWKTQDEFYQNLKKLKELYPSSTPFTSKNQSTLFNHLSTSWGIVANSPYYDEEDGLWKYSDTDPKMKDMLDFLKKLYSEGLLDPEFLTLTQSAWTSKMTQAEKAFVTFDWIGRLDSFTKEASKTVPGYDLRYGYPIGPKGTLITLPRVSGGIAVSQNQNTELALKISDFMLSPAGAQLVTMGTENVTYTIGEDGKAQYIEFPDHNPTIEELEQKYGLFIGGIFRRFDRRSSYFIFSEREQEAQDFASKENIFEPLDPVLRFTAEQKEIINDKMPALRKASSEFFSNYILTEKTGDSAWNEWIQKAKTLGADEIVANYNAAQKEYNKP